jgi:hypothetical protein
MFFYLFILLLCQYLTLGQFLLVSTCTIEASSRAARDFGLMKGANEAHTSFGHYEMKKSQYDVHHGSNLCEMMEISQVLPYIRPISCVVPLQSVLSSYDAMLPTTIFSSQLTKTPEILPIRELIYRKPTHRKPTNRIPRIRDQPPSSGHHATGHDSKHSNSSLAQPLLETLLRVNASFTAFITNPEHRGENVKAFVCVTR